jgi:uncharacterized membrane protein YjfL (UPF0719 family)
MDVSLEENMTEALLSLVQLLVAIVLSIVAIYLAFFLFQWMTRDLDEWQALRDGNLAVGIVLASCLVGVALVLRPALAINVESWDTGRALFTRALLVQGIQLVIGLILSVLTLLLSFYLFAWLTPGIDELEEIRKGNLAVASLLGGAMVGVSLMVSQALQQIMALLGTALF